MFDNDEPEPLVARIWNVAVPEMPKRLVPMVPVPGLAPNAKVLLPVPLALYTKSKLVSSVELSSQISVKAFEAVTAHLRLVGAFGAATAALVKASTRKLRMHRRTARREKEHEAIGIRQSGKQKSGEGSEAACWSQSCKRRQASRPSKRHPRGNFVQQNARSTAGFMQDDDRGGEAAAIQQDTKQRNGCMAWVKTN